MLSCTIIICVEGTLEWPEWRMNKWDWRTLTKVGSTCEVVEGKSGMPGWNVSASEVHPQWLGRWSLNHLVVSHRFFLSHGKSHRCQQHCYCILCAVVVWHPDTPDMVAHMRQWVQVVSWVSTSLQPSARFVFCLKKSSSFFKGKSAEISDQKLKRGTYVMCLCESEDRVMQNTTAA